MLATVSSAPAGGRLVLMWGRVTPHLIKGCRDKSHRVPSVRAVILTDHSWSSTGSWLELVGNDGWAVIKDLSYFIKGEVSLIKMFVYIF